MITHIKAGDWAKPCRDCGQTEAEGAVFGVGDQRANGKKYRKSYCRVCARARSKAHYEDNPEQAKAREARRTKRPWQQKWNNVSPEIRYRKVRAYNIRAKHGISLEEYEFRFEQQGSTCPICEEEISLGRKGPGRPAHLDHDHKTNKLREFLCDRCNVMVGMSRESQDILSQAVLYLERHNGR